MPSIIKKPSRCAMQRYREIINNSSSWTQLRDCFNGTLLLYINMLLSKISFLSPAQSAYSGTHVASSLNSAVSLCTEKCKLPSQERSRMKWLVFSFLGWGKTESGSAPTWLKIKDSLHHAATTAKESLCRSLVVFVCSNQILGSNASLRSCTKMNIL